MTVTENDNISMQPDPEDTASLSDEWVDDDTEESEFDEEIELVKDDDEELEAEEE